MLLGFIEAAKLKAFDKFTLKDAMKCFDVGIFFRCCHMCKFLFGFKLNQKAPYLIG